MAKTARCELERFIFKAGNSRRPLPHSHAARYIYDDMVAAGCPDDDFGAVLDILRAAAEADRGAAHKDTWTGRITAILWGFRHIGVLQTIETIKGLPSIN